MENYSFAYLALTANSIGLSLYFSQVSTDSLWKIRGIKQKNIENVWELMDYEKNLLNWKRSAR